MILIEAGTLNTSTGAEEASDSVVRFNPGGAVTAGVEYEFVYNIEATSPLLFFFNEGGEFLTYINAASGEAPEGAVTCRATLDTGGVTEFAFDFRPVPEYHIDAAIGLAGNPADLTWYMGDGTVITGFEAQHNYESSLLKSIAVYASIKDWTGLESLDLPDCDLVGTCSMVNLDVFSQAEIDLSGNPLLTRIQFAASVSGQLLSLDLSGCGVTTVNWSALAGCLQIANLIIDLSDNGLTESQVDAHLVALEEIIESGYSGREIVINGTNAAPGTAGMAAIGLLEDKGLTVTYTT